MRRHFLLTSGSEDIRKIGRLLAEAGLTDCEVIVGYQLSYPEESIRILTPGQCEEITKEGSVYLPDPQSSSSSRNA